MLRIKKVLFPTDFSECAERAFAHAVFLADQYAATLHVLSIMVPFEGEPGNPMAYLQDLSEEAVDLAEYISDSESDLQTNLSVVYAREADVSAASGILSYAQEQDVDLIVMGTHGRRGIDHAFMGSVAEEVARVAPCPVFTIGMNAPAKPGQDIHNLLIPVDFSAFGGPALSYAKELALVYGAKLHLLHVIEDIGLPGAYGYGASARFSINLSEMEKNSCKALRAIGIKVLGEEVPFEVHAIGGNAALDTVDFAAAHDIDLIVMATHGRTGIRRLVIGSVAEKVIRMARCPVFTVKSFGKSLLPPEEEERATVKAESFFTTSEMS